MQPGKVIFSTATNTQVGTTSYLDRNTTLDKIKTKIKDFERRDVVTKTIEMFDIGDRVKLTMASNKRGINATGTVLGYKQDNYRGFVLWIKPENQENPIQVTIAPKGFEKVDSAIGLEVRVQNNQIILMAEGLNTSIEKLN